MFPAIHRVRPAPDNRHQAEPSFTYPNIFFYPYWFDGRDGTTALYIDLRQLNIQSRRTLAISNELRPTFLIRFPVRLPDLNFPVSVNDNTLLRTPYSHSRPPSPNS